MAGRGGKAKVAFNKPAEPKFIRELKAQVGYKEPIGLDAKMGGGGGGEMEDREDRDDEKPTIVVMKEGDLTEEEVDQVQVKLNDSVVEEVIPKDGRILFKKPTKRENSDENDSDKDVKHKKKKKDKKETKLLSFDEDEED